MTEGEPQFLAIGERAALGPLRRDLLATYARWVNEPPPSSRVRCCARAK
jgi:hypothetical protein